MKGKSCWTTLVALSALLGGAVLLIFFMPRSYGTPDWERSRTVRYWDLKTGSRIAYHHLVGRGKVRRETPIIYLHGGPGGLVSERLFQVLAPLQDAGFDLYFYDQIGGGHSARLAAIAEYTLTRHQEDLAAIIERLGTPQVILIAQSWGAILASHFLAQHPERIAKVILTGPAPIYPLRPELAQRRADPKLGLQAPTFTNEMANQKWRNLRTRCIDWCATILGQKIASDQEVDDYFSQLNRDLRKATVCDPERARRTFTRGGYYCHIMTLASLSQAPDHRSRFRQIQTPLLLLRGTCDNQAWGFTEEYLDLFPGAELRIIKGAGHLIFDEAPVEYWRAILRFCVE